VRLQRGGRLTVTPSSAATSSGTEAKKAALASSPSDPPGPLSQPAQPAHRSRARVGADRVQPAQRPRPGEQAPLGRTGVGAEHLSASVDERPRSSSTSSRFAGSCATSSGLVRFPPDSAVNSWRLAASCRNRPARPAEGSRWYCLITRTARQAERVLRDPGPEHHRAAAAAQILGIRQGHRRPVPTSEELLGEIGAPAPRPRRWSSSRPADDRLKDGSSPPTLPAGQLPTHHSVPACRRRTATAPARRPARCRPD